MSRPLHPESGPRSAEACRALLDIGDDRLREALAAHLARRGWRTETARGREALRQVDARWPDVVVSDLAIADVDPLRVLIAGAERGVPSLVCARPGDAALLEPRFLRAAGVRDVVTLPASLEDLTLRLAAVVAGSRGRRSSQMRVAALAPAAGVGR
jgi:DNA-binding response OmpR family regulator